MSVTTIDAELVAEAGAMIGEGPFWDDGAFRLYWIDIKARRLHTFNPLTGVDASLDLGTMPGSVVVRRGGGLLMAAAEGFCFLDPSTGAASPLFDPEADRPGNRFNDGKCDSRGRFWIGSMADSGKGRDGALYRLDPDLSCRRLLDGLGISNGLAWSLDERRMFHIDSPARRVDAFDFDLESGGISDRRPVIELPPALGFPDGMTIDEEGMLWVALWGGWGVGRFDPRTGRRIAQVELPVANVTSCAFGRESGGEDGSSLDTLYITTAKAGLSASESKDQPCAGGLFRCRPGIGGAPSLPFAG